MYAARLFLLFSFPYSADHERDWPPCKLVFFGLATNTNMRNNHEEVLYLQPLILPKRFDIFLPNRGMLRRFRCVLIFL